MGGLILLAGGLIGGRSGLFIALVIALGVNGFAYFNSDKLAIRAMRAFPVTETQAPQLYAIVNGSTSASATFTQTLTVGQTYHVRLAMRGTSIFRFRSRRAEQAQSPKCKVSSFST